MKENVGIACEYDKKCNQPEREIKCMGYKEKEKEDEQKRKDYKFNQLDFFYMDIIKYVRYISSQYD